MDKYTLIKLTEGYIIVSDINIQDKDIKYILSPSNEINTFKSFETGIGTTEICWIKVKETTTLQQVSNSQKIIASNFIPELSNIDFNNLEEEFGIIDVEKLTFNIYPEIIKEKWCEEGLAYKEDINEGNRESFIEGFNKCLELNKDKLYTEKDIKNAIKWLTKNYSKVEDELAHPLETNQVELPDNFFENVYEEALNRAIQSLQPKTEWDVEVEKTENSIKIIK